MSKPIYLSIEEAEATAQAAITARAEVRCEQGPRLTPWGVIMKHLEVENVDWAAHHATRIEQLLAREGWFIGDAHKTGDVLLRLKRAFANGTTDEVMAIVPEVIVLVNQLQSAANRLQSIEGEPA